MALIRWDPFRDMMTLREKMNRLFDDTFKGEERDLFGGTWAPSVDIYETESELVLNAEIPGIKEEDIEVKIEDNSLTLHGERKLEEETNEENYHRIERSYGSLYRSFSLPHYIDQEKIKAEHDNGVLRIHMPKKPELKPRSVKILKPEKTKVAVKKSKSKK
ncbi:MAG: Hsp20 family protein [Candidatus Aminicenantes bacterium]|nr:Hsp20 family protein [Candidatus Aminicenantes bacterium]